jgi:hypothetical protein
MQVFLQFSQLNHASSHAKSPLLRDRAPRAARCLPWQHVPQRAA